MEDERIQKIVVGLDEDFRAEPALRQGLRLARLFEADLELVHAVPVPPALWPGVDGAELERLHTRALTNARARITEQVGPMLRSESGSRCDLERDLSIRPGHPAKVLLDRVRDLRADLVLLGPHVRRGTLDFGNVMRAVVAKCDAPVWVQGDRPNRLRRILVGIDFSEESRLALDFAVTLAKRSSASLVLLHAFEPPRTTFYNSADYWVPGPDFVGEAEGAALRERLDALVRATREHGVDVEGTVEEGRATARLLAHETESDTDLTVLGTHGRTGLSRFLLGNHAQAVLAHSARHVLVVPNPGRRWILGRRAEALAVAAQGSI